MKFSILLALVLASGTAWSESKKTVCSITLNSPNEINALKEKLPSEQFNFVELTENTRAGSDWFKNSCDAKLQCDVLLISGHFAGTFFGDTNLTLGINSLETLSCKTDCDGILKKPKEVFLFGCNTLAGKNTDNRTPEEYVNVLLQDGFSPAQAQQVAAFRYSPIGSRFSYRMTQIFNKTPRIYGFNGQSPKGKINGPAFLKYLKPVAKDYSAYLDQITTEPNEPILKLFSGGNMVQEKGSALEKAELSPTCFLSSENKTASRIEKLKWMVESLEKSDSLELIVHFTEFLKVQNFQKKWNPEEQDMIRRISQIAPLKEQLMGILALDKFWLKRTQTEILEFIKISGIIDAKSYNTEITKILNLNKKDFSKDDMQFVCGINIQADLNIKEIADSQWGNQNFRSAISCLNPRSVQIWDRINQHERNY
ncbi:MAG: hypothetical protein WA160_04710 [Pseudobdellovibrio sp.]